MQDHLITQLKKFRVIEPSPAFKEKTLSLILRNGAERRWSFKFDWVWAPAFASLILAVVVGGKLLSAKPALSSFNPEGLRNEFNDLNINIELKEISYRQEVSQEIASAITEISDNKTSHLSPSVLEAEAQDIKLDESNQTEINNLLDRVIF